jgi:uncharacterized protein (TIGR04255 family)
MGKKMKSAPVYFTIAQVKYNRILKRDSYIPDIQDLMRKAGYPDIKRGQAISISISQPTPEADPQPPNIEKTERLFCFNIEGTKGFIVEENLLSFYVTDYDIFDTFLKDFMTGMEIVHSVLNLDLCERIGLRYLNAVVPPKGQEGLAEYLSAGVLGISNTLPDEVDVLYSTSETRMQIKSSTVLVKTIIRNGALGFPQELQPIGVKVAEKFKSICGVHASVDVDSFAEDKKIFDLKDIMQQFHALKQGNETAFKSTVTSYAINEWLDGFAKEI